MTEYKRHIYKMNDKVVIRLDNTAKNRLNKGKDNITISTEQVLSDLTDFQPAEPKIKFTAEEKKEFDNLKNDTVTLLSALAYMSDKKCPKLYSKLFKGNAQISFEEQNKAQLEFSKAWEKPSRIEVIEPEKREIKIGRQHLQLSHSNVFLIATLMDGTGRKTEFTLDQVKEAEEQLGIQGLQDKWHEAAKECGE